jgi:hypothetical protein
MSTQPWNPAKDLAEGADADDRERKARIENAWEAYYGQSPEALKVRRGERTNDNVRLNWGRLIVDTGVAYLFGDDLRVQAPEGDGQEALQAVLDDLIHENGGPLLWQRMGLSGAIGGTVYYRLAPDDDGDVRITVLDPGMMDIDWDPDDFEKITSYTIEWNTVDEEGDGAARRQVIEQDEGGMSWTIYDQEARTQLDQWGEVAGVEWVTTQVTPWPHDYPPVGHWQNLPSPHEVYGLSDLEPDVLKLVASIERVVANINRIVRLYAHPRTWGTHLGDMGKLLSSDPGGVMAFDHPDARLQNLEMSSDLASSLELYAKLVAALHETTRVPEIATGKVDNVGQLSGLALQILYSPLVQKTESKRRTAGHGLVEMFRRILDLMGQGDQIHVALGWAEILPDDPLSERQTALMDMQLGVSRQTIMERLGYDPVKEIAQRSEEDAVAADTQMRQMRAGGLGVTPGA